MRLSSLVRPNILALKAYSSARDEYQSTEDVTLLDANENPYESNYNRYPDPYQRELKSQISELKGVDTNCIFLGNGSDEAIDLIFRIFCEPTLDNIIIPDPTYGMYEVSAAIQNIEVRRVPLSQNFELKTDDILAATDIRSKVLFLCNPNNPTGNLLDKNSIKELLERFNGIVVIDEAYVDFSNSDSFTNELDQYDNLIVLQTFSKAWGLAGLRLGMAFCSEEIIKLFNKVKAPYNLSISTQRLALDLLRETKASTEANIKSIIESREYVRQELGKMDIIDKIYDSESNFLLVKFKNHETAYNQLKFSKLIVRDRSKALNCNGCLRITIGTPKENENLIKTLKAL